MTTTSELIDLQAQAAAFARRHLRECAAEVVAMQDTSVRPAGRMDELIALFDKVVGGRDSRSVAEAEVKRAALEFAAKHAS